MPHEHRGNTLQNSTSEAAAVLAYNLYPTGSLSATSHQSTTVHWHARKPKAEPLRGAAGWDSKAESLETPRLTLGPQGQRKKSTALPSKFSPLLQGTLFLTHHRHSLVLSAGARASKLYLREGKLWLAHAMMQTEKGRVKLPCHLSHPLRACSNPTGGSAEVERTRDLFAPPQGGSLAGARSSSLSTYPKSSHCPAKPWLRISAHTARAQVMLPLRC